MSGASEGGYDIYKANVPDGFGPYVDESLIFPYGGIRNDDGSYSYVNKQSLMILQKNYYSIYIGWNWNGSMPWSVDTDHGYVRCMREQL